MNRADRRALAKQIAQDVGTGAVDLAQLAAKKKTITLAYMYNETGARPTGSWVRSLLAVAARSNEFGFQVRPRECETGPHLSRARNLLLKSFLETEDEYLLFTDTDIAFAPQDVAMLLAADAPIAGALYFTAALGTQPWPTAMVEGQQAEDGPGTGDVSAKPGLVPLTLPTPPEDFDEANQEQLEAWMAELAIPIKVDAVGMGLTLIKREVCEKVAAAYPYPFEYIGDQGEDLIFCLRAKELGYDTVVVPAARVGHIKVAML